MSERDERIANIKSRREKATVKGAWLIHDGSKKWVTTASASDEDWRQNHQNDAAFVAHAGDDIKWLLDYVEKLHQGYRDLQELSKHLRLPARAHEIIDRAIET